MSGTKVPAYEGSANTDGVAARQAQVRIWTVAVVVINNSHKKNSSQQSKNDVDTFPSPMQYRKNFNHINTFYI